MVVRVVVVMVSRVLVGSVDEGGGSNGLRVVVSRVVVVAVVRVWARQPCVAQTAGQFRYYMGNIECIR